MSKKAAATPRTYALGDVVLGKVKGYPAWPGQVVSLDTVPAKVLGDKSFKSRNTTIVQFFPKGDYAGLTGKDLSPLTTIEIEAFLARSKGKGTEIQQGYRVALEPTEWNANRAAGVIEYEALQAAVEEDELESDGEGAGDAGDQDKVKKRKRKSEVGEKGEKEDKKAKKAKMEKLVKGRSKVTAAYSEDDAEPSTKKSKSKNDDNDDSPGLKQVKEWRHRLQKAFLGKTVAGAEMPKCHEFFVAMEAFEMRTDWLTMSKLGKVLKHINVLADGKIPREEEFNFRQRSAALATRWSAAVVGAPAPDSSNAAAAPADVEMADAAAPVVEAAAPAVVPEVVAEVPVVEEKVAEVATNGSAEVPAAEPIVSNGAAVEAPVVEAPKVEESKVEEAKVEEVAAPAPVEAVAV